MVLSTMLARQATLLDPLPTTLTPLLRYSCKLFVARANVKSFAIKQIRTLCAKHPGWGTLGVFLGARAAPDEDASLTSFRMNTCKSVTKQTTLTLFRMNT